MGNSNSTIEIHSGSNQSSDKLNIAFDFENFWGGAPLSLSEYCRIASEAGHTVIVLTQTLNGLEVVSQYASSVLIHHPVKPHYPLAMCRLAQWYVDVFQKYNIHVVHSIRPLHLPALGYAAGMTGSKIVMTKATNSSHYPFLYSSYKATWITYNHEYAQTLQSLGIGDFYRIPNRINLTGRISCSRPQQGSLNRIKLIWLGRLVEEKTNSFYSLVDSLASNHLFPAVHIQVLGDGPKTSELKAYASSRLNETCHSIEFSGYVKDPLAHLIDASLCIGMARCIVEALACECLAIIGTSSGEGILVTEHNYEMLRDSNFTGRGCESYPMSVEISAAIMNLGTKKTTMLRERVLMEFDTTSAKALILSVYASVRKYQFDRDVFLLSKYKLASVLARLFVRHILSRSLGRRRK